MKREYLGDSYDAVKRFWRDVLKDWAPLHAEPRFIPADLHREFTALTGIPVLPDPCPSYYAILNDPDTGIRLPERENQTEGRRHIALPTIREQTRISGVRCVITFDQSSHRMPGVGAKDQRAAKLEWLHRHGVPAFYYVSHAPFMFAFAGPKHFDKVRSLLSDAGMPEARIEVRA